MKAAAASIRAQGFPDSVEELRTNKVPTLAIIGEADLNRGDVDWTAEAMSNFEVVVIPGADHNGAVKHPMFIKAVLNFLSRHKTEASAQGP